MPANVKLTNAVVLHNVSVIRWMKETVTLKHTGGIDVIYYSHIAQPDRTTVLAVRDDAVKNHKTDLSAKPVDNSMRGTVSVATEDGGEGPLPNVKVYAVPMASLGMLTTPLTRVRLPKPLASAVTGPDGRFSMEVPAGEDFFIFAKATRLVGQSWEYYEWRVPGSQISDRQGVELTKESVIPLSEQKAVTFD
ncbi:MAG TPA: hypothetical protein VKG78_03455 [Opitutaceae bacterium]|nr:hypothetical protein [Opitutaceae bacterium]